MAAKRLPELEKLAEWLKSLGYQVVRTQVSNAHVAYSFWKVAGNNIVGAFCEPTRECYTQISGRFAADHVDAFDKWSKCPLVVDVNRKLDYESLKRHLLFLGSDEGFHHSNTFAYLDESVLPRVA